jgi:hypothetical protein
MVLKSRCCSEQCSHPGTVSGRVADFDPNEEPEAPPIGGACRGTTERNEPALPGWDDVHAGATAGAGGVAPTAAGALQARHIV